MLTPRFELTQTNSEVIVTVHAPYANIKDTEVYVEGSDLRFFSAPYYLRLNLPGEIEENDASSGSYDCEKGDFLLKFSKVNVGEHFENLDMITTLLAPKKRGPAIPTIEVISNPVVNSEEGISENLEKDETDGDINAEGDQWFVSQNLPSDNTPLSLEAPKYGFAGKVSNALVSFEAGWTGEIVDLPTPDITPSYERRSLKEKHEFEHFSEEHYMADLIQQECVEPYIEFVAEWESLKGLEAVSMSDAEKDLLKELPNKEYLLDSREIEKVCFGLIDILYGSCYNHRTTMGDNTVESGWAVNKLSSTLCWFHEFSSMQEVVTACIRRSLCYPLYRNWDLSVKVFQDVKSVIKLGKKYIIKRFCEIHELFNNSYEPRYILNQLYIKDYLVWLQQVPATVIESLTTTLDSIKPAKMDIGLDLVELEAAAYSVQEEDLIIENAVHEVTDQVNDLNIDETESDKARRGSSSTSDSSDTDSETDSDSSSSSSSSSDTSLDSDDTSEPE